MDSFSIALRFEVRKFSRFSGASLLYFAMGPCNWELEILHRYPVSCASVSIKSISETFCAGQKSRQPLCRPELEFFCRLCRFVCGSVHYIKHITWQGQYYFNEMHVILQIAEMPRAIVQSRTVSNQNFVMLSCAAEFSVSFAGTMSTIPQYSFHKMYIIV